MRRPRFALKAVLVLAGLSLATAAPRGVEITQRQKVILEIRPLTAEAMPGSETPFRLEVDPDRGGDLDLRVRWPESKASKVRFYARELTRDAGGAHVLEILGELQLPEGKRVRSSRRIAFKEGTTSLFELFRKDERSLLFAVAGEIVTETVLPLLPEVTQGVQLELEIQRVQEGKVYSLENNLLNTFLGETVTYSFDLGRDSDAVRIDLKPLWLAGDVATIDVGLSGILPTEAGPELVSRTEQWATTRGATSTVAFEIGEPPTGYRFLITPRF